MGNNLLWEVPEWKRLFHWIGWKREDRLREFGLIPGGVIRCRMRSAGGDPTAYEIRGTVIAIRREDAARIRVCGNIEAAAWG